VDHFEQAGAGMGSGRNVAVFGAYGHTGRFVVAELRERGYVPLLLGRDQDKLLALAQARKKKVDAQVLKVPGVNHLLVPAKTGEVAEYATLAVKTVSPEVAATLAAWVASVPR
jgi:short subunit dehydrogenase-like uncharacterized protein